MTVAEGIRFHLEAEGATPLDAMKAVDRLARNLVADWPTDWPIEYREVTLLRLDKYGETSGWRAAAIGHARDNSGDRS